MVLQRQYVLDMLSKYGMARWKPIFVSMDHNGKVGVDVGYVLEDATMYRKIGGSLIYVMTISKPDLRYTIGLEI